MIKFDHYIEPAYKINGISDVMIGRTNVMMDLFHYLNHLAVLPTAVLLQGETGTGKELCAKALHQNGNDQRSEHKFVAVNCANIPPELLESELFGHVRGAFTGAFQSTIGKFQYANRGTLLLDEIGDMSPQLQAKVLRVLEEKQVTRLGSNKAEEVDVRIIASTNKILEDEVEEGRFRKDLFYRLNVIPVIVPPLRKRSDDIPLIAEYFIKKCNERYGVHLEGLSPVATEKLKRHEWDGNVRELENIIERVFVLRRGGVIEAKDLYFKSTMPRRIPILKRGVGLEATLGTIGEDRGATPKKKRTLENRPLVTQ